MQSKGIYIYFTGQIVSAVKDGCRKAFQMQPQRLMAAMYSCDIIVDQKVLGKFIFKLLQIFQASDEIMNKDKIYLDNEYIILRSYFYQEYYDLFSLTNPSMSAY